MSLRGLTLRDCGCQPVYVRIENTPWDAPRRPRLSPLPDGHGVRRIRPPARSPSRFFSLALPFVVWPPLKATGGRAADPVPEPCSFHSPFRPFTPTQKFGVVVCLVCPAVAQLRCSQLLAPSFLHVCCIFGFLPPPACWPFFCNLRRLSSSLVGHVGFPSQVNPREREMGTRCKPRSLPPLRTYNFKVPDVLLLHKLHHQLPGFIITAKQSALRPVSSAKRWRIKLIPCAYSASLGPRSCAVPSHKVLISRAKHKTSSISHPQKESRRWQLFTPKVCHHKLPARARVVNQIKCPLLN
ncbi:hypothetical protein J3F83DRAFT_729018 [Trichoderma novae-zelandiae]